MYPPYRSRTASSGAVKPPHYLAAGASSKALSSTLPSSQEPAGATHALTYTAAATMTPAAAIPVSSRLHTPHPPLMPLPSPRTTATSRRESQAPSVVSPAAGSRAGGSLRALPHVLSSAVLVTPSVGRPSVVSSGPRSYAASRANSRKGLMAVAPPQSDALAAVRNSHRLRCPEDAFLLGGPVVEAQGQRARSAKAREAAVTLGVDAEAYRMMSPTGRMRAMQTAERRRRLLSSGTTTAAGAGGSPNAAADGSSVRRRRKDRSFLPEDLAAREAQAQAKQARAERRERHEQKKAARQSLQQQQQQQQQQRSPARRRDVAEEASRATPAAEGGAPDGCEGPESAEKAEKAHLRRLLAAHREQLQEQGPCHSSEVDEAESSPRRIHASGTDEAAPPAAEEGSPLSSCDRKERRSVAKSAGEGRSTSANSLSTLSDTIPASDADSIGSSAAGADDEEDEEDEVETPMEQRERLEREVMLHYAAMYARRTRAVLVIQRAWRCSRARLALYNRRQLLYQFLYVRQKAAAMCIIGLLRTRVQQRHCRDTLQLQRVSEGDRAAQERVLVHSVRVIERAAARWLQQRQERARLRQLLGIAKDARLQRYAVAAVLVQRWWRVVPQRRTYWQRRNAEVAEQRQREAERDRRERAATMIQKHFRGVLGRRDFNLFRVTRRQELAARQQRLRQCTDVVRLVLGEYEVRLRRLAEERVAAQEQAEEAVDRIARGWQQALARRRLDVAVREATRLRTSATAIQRAWRRYHAGRELRYLRSLQKTVEAERLAGELRVYQATRCLQRFAREVVLRRRRERLSRAAYGRAAFAALAVLQTVGRGFLARQALGHHLHARLRERQARAATDAALQARAAALAEAIIIDSQSLYVSYAAAAAHLAEMAELRLYARREIATGASAAVIQRATRRWLRRREAQRQQDELHAARAYVVDAVLLLQRWWRRLHARRVVVGKAREIQVATRYRLDWEDVIVALRDAEEAHEAVVSSGKSQAAHTAAVSEVDRAWANIYDEDEDEDDDDNSPTGR